MAVVSTRPYVNNLINKIIIIIRNSSPITNINKYI